MASLAWGSRYIHFSEVISSLTQSKDMSFNALVVRERIPRTVFSLIAGASLGVSGALMQSITRNPIADPSILGVKLLENLFTALLGAVEIKKVREELPLLKNKREDLYEIKRK